MSDLSKFCKAVLVAVETEDHPFWFYDFCGLCHNSRRYDLEHGTRVNWELKEILGKEDYPFNNSSQEQYDEEYAEETMYKNEKRLAFLREHAKG